MAEIPVSEDGAAVTARVGDEIVVRLQEVATTGHRWTLQAGSGAVEVVADDYVPPGGGAPGAAGERVVRLRVREAGEADVVLVLRRPWESAAEAAAGRFTAHVSAR